MTPNSSSLPSLRTIWFIVSFICPKGFSKASLSGSFIFTERTSV